jgi:phosphoserine phosphatase RsbU/P
LTYVNAGHNPPIIATATDSQVKLLTAGGPIIGAFLDQRYEQDKVFVASGNVVVVYTDGVTEAVSPDGIEFGEGRLRSIVLEVRSFSARQAAEHVIEKVLEWQGHSSQHDDITLIVMKVK